jgi:hypothetical protein
MKTTIRLFLAFLCFSVAGPKAKAVSPAPDGGYPGGNTAEGQTALLSLTTGGFNTAVGWLSLRSNTTGSFNTASGAGTLVLNTADGNTAFGTAALLFNTTGNANTANGAFALYSNTTGVYNTATGNGALSSNTTGSFNTAIGLSALLSNTTGGVNTATGQFALLFNTTGNANTATGDSALYSNTIGHNNTATGDDALSNNATGNFNTAVGNLALLNSTGTGNIALGYNAGSNLTSGDNNIYLGSLGVATESNTIRIGTSGTQDRAFIRGIRGVTTGNNDAIPVLIDTAGQLGTTSSSRRFKKEIKPMDSASEAILALKPVTFHYKSDTKDTPQFGLIAEEVAEVNPDLVVRDENGEIYTVRYDAVNAMLLNEFLREHRKVENLENAFQATVAQQQREIAALTETVKEQAGQIQRVSAQLQLCKPVAQTVASDQ